VYRSGVDFALFFGQALLGAAISIKEKEKLT
jgi:hypothetical protein